MNAGGVDKACKSRGCITLHVMQSIKLKVYKVYKVGARIVAFSLRTL